MGYYRQLARVKPAEADIGLRDRIQRITLSNRRYGYRRVSAELRRQGFTVNHKKVLRLMRNDNLLAIRKRRYVLTTDSDQQRAAYPNWAKALQVDGTGQLWQADITCVRMRRSFARPWHGPFAGALMTPRPSGGSIPTAAPLIDGMTPVSVIFQYTRRSGPASSHRIAAGMISTAGLTWPRQQGPRFSPSPAGP